MKSKRVRMLPVDLKVSNLRASRSTLGWQTTFILKAKSIPITLNLVSHDQSNVDLGIETSKLLIKQGILNL